MKNCKLAYQTKTKTFLHTSIFLSVYLYTVVIMSVLHEDSELDTLNSENKIFGDLKNK